MKETETLAEMATQLLTAVPTLNEMGLTLEMSFWPSTEYYGSYLALRVSKVQIVEGKFKCTYNEGIYVEATEMEKATGFIENCIKENK